MWCSQVGSCIGAFLKKFNDAVFPLLEKLMPILGGLLEKTRTPEERRIGVCIMDDLLEHSPVGGEKYVHEVLPILMEAMREEDPDLRQCSVYGIGVVAGKFPQVIANYHVSDCLWGIGCQPRFTEILHCLAGGDVAVLQWS